MQHLPNVGKSIFGNYHCSNTAFQIFKKMQLQLGLPEHCLTLGALISPIDDIWPLHSWDCVLSVMKHFKMLVIIGVRDKAMKMAKKVDSVFFCLSFLSMRGILKGLSSGLCSLPATQSGGQCSPQCTVYTTLTYMWLRMTKGCYLTILKKKWDIYIFRFPILLAIWWCIRFFSLTLQSRDINGWQISKFKGHIDLKKMFITLIWNDFHLHYFHIIILSFLFVCVKFESIASLLSYSINLMALNYTV